jgi:hypothetical protein
MTSRVACAVAALALLAAPAHASRRSDGARLLRLTEAIEKAESGRYGAAQSTATRVLQECDTGPGNAPQSVSMLADDRAGSLITRHTLAAVAADYRRAARRLHDFTARTRLVRDAARTAATVRRDLLVLAKDPPDICDYFSDWKADGWSADFRADPPAPDFTQKQRAELDRTRTRLRAAGRALKRYGLSRRRVDAFVNAYDAGNVLAFPRL